MPTVMLPHRMTVTVVDGPNNKDGQPSNSSTTEEFDIYREDLTAMLYYLHVGGEYSRQRSPCVAAPH